MKATISSFKQHFQENQHHYFFSLFGVFAVVKAILLFAGFFGLMNLANTFAQTPLELNSGNITQAPFNCATSATSCDLSSKGITSIASGTFSGYTNLTTLNLNYNYITSIESGDFAGLSALTILFLYSNQIMSIESGAFAGLSALTILNLAYNHITSIESGDFAGLDNLNELNLGGNQLTSIESDDFTGLSALTILGLNNNQLISLPETFTELTSLGNGSLFIDNNKLCTGNWSSNLLMFVNTKANNPNWQTTQNTSACQIPPPTATNVLISGTPQVGQTLTGNYTYNYSDPEDTGASLYQWYRSGVIIPGATGLTYTVQPEDAGKTITFEVTPISEGGIQGSHVVSDGIYIPKPTATNVLISGTPEIGQTLTGSYTYNYSYPEDTGASLYQWYRNGLVITGSTGLTYTVQSEDAGKIITFEVTPMSQGGIQGTPALSNELQMDVDTDNDGIFDNADNCPLVVNTGQADIDSNGTGDACDCNDSICTTGNDYTGNLICTSMDLACPISEFCANVTDIPQSECEALLALYTGTNGTGWNNDTNRGVSTTACTRYGITCSSNHVQSIDLSNNSLSGTLPAQIGNLSELGDLVLNNNYLSGTIPIEIGNITGLSSLNLNNNQLYGDVPAEIGNLTSLFALHLSSNQFTSLPSEIVNNPLEFLKIGHNKLTTLPESLIGNSLLISDINTIDIDYNNICLGNMSAGLIDFINLSYQSTSWQATQNTTNCQTFLQCSVTDHVVIAKVSPIGDDYVVLYNPTDVPINLSGWTFDTNGQSQPHDATITGNHFITAHGFFSIGNSTGDHIEAISIAQSNGGVDIRDEYGHLVDSVARGTSYVPNHVIGEGTPFTPNPTTAGPILERKAFVQSTMNSMMSSGIDYYNGNGYDTNNNATDFIRVKIETGIVQGSTSPAETCSESLPQIIITEFMYNPDPLNPNNYEWVELYNAGNLPINVQGWKRDSNPFNCNKDIVSGRGGGTTIIPSHGYAVITEQFGYAFDGSYTIDPSAIKLKVDDDAIGCYGLKDDVNETHRLSLEDGTTWVTQGTYSKYRGANGSGKSLQLVNYTSGWNQFNVCGSLPTMGSDNYCIPPVLVEITPVPTPANDTTPNYTFYIDEAVTITYGGDCSTTPGVSITAGVYTATFAPLPAGDYTNCTVTATDAAGNTGVLQVSEFFIEPDVDADGISDNNDNCPLVANSGQEDSNPLIGAPMIDTASYDNKSFAYSGEMPYGRGIWFSDDGNKLYVNDENTSIFEYELSTPRDVSTTTYANKSFDYSGRSSNIDPTFIRDNGTKLYLVKWEPATIYQYTLGTGRDISTASYDSKSYDLTTQITGNYTEGVFMSPDGTKIYASDYYNGKMYQYTLSTPYDISTMSYDNKSFDTTSELSSIGTVILSSDGSKFYTYDSDGIMYQYELSTAWDISTATYEGLSYNFQTGMGSRPYDFYMNPDGTKIYANHGNNREIWQFSLQGGIISMTGDACDCNDNICTTGNDVNGNLICNPDPICPVIPGGGGGNGGGGGGGGTLYKDYCLDGDLSPSYYDNTCGTKTNTGTDTHGSAYDCTIEGSTYSSEANAAFLYTCNLGMTESTSLKDIDIKEYILRKDVAKMISLFAVKELDMQPDVEYRCRFSDISNESEDLKSYMELSCQLGIMGLKKDGSPDTIFNPNQYVTRAQFGTMLSRLIYGDVYNVALGSKTPWYQNHLQALQKNEIMMQISNPTIKKEMKGWIMLMLYRISQQ